MKSRLYIRSFRALVSIIASMLLILIASIIVNISDVSKFTDSFRLEDFILPIMFITFLMYMFLSFSAYPSKKEIFCYFNKTKKERKEIYSKEESDELESEAEYVKRATEHFDNPENLRECR